MSTSEPLQRFDDQVLEEKMRSEIRWAFFGVDMELLSILDVEWKRVMPGKDELPYEFEYSDHTSPHVLFTAKCLVRSEGELSVMCDAFLYLESSLAEAGKGPQATPDYFADLKYETLDLCEELQPELREALLALARDEYSEAIAKLAVSHEGPDRFIASIKDNDVRNAFGERWDKASRQHAGLRAPAE